MSWQDYVDVQLLGNGTIRHAAMIGHDGSIWAQSAGFKMDQANITKVTQAHANPGVVQMGGLTMNDKKFMFIRGDDQTVILKKATSTMFLRKTNQTIIIAMHDEEQVPEPASLTVEKLGEYLESVSY